MPSVVARCAHVDTARHLARLVDKANRCEPYTIAEQQDAFLVIKLLLANATADEKQFATGVFSAAAGPRKAA